MAPSPAELPGEERSWAGCGLWGQDTLDAADGMGGLGAALGGFLPREWGAAQLWAVGFGILLAPGVMAVPSAGAANIISPHLPHPGFGGTPGLVTSFSIPSNWGESSQPLPRRTNPNPLDPLSNPPTQVPNNSEDSANKKSITIYSIQLFHTYSTGSASALLGAARTVLSN